MHKREIYRPSRGEWFLVDNDASVVRQRQGQREAKKGIEIRVWFVAIMWTRSDDGRTA